MTAETMPVRVLIIDDDEEDFFLTSQYIKKIRGKEFIIDWCYRYKDALEAIAALRVPTSAIRDVRLACEGAAEIGYPEHAVIVGWHEDPFESGKSETLDAQNALATAVTQDRVQHLGKTKVQ